MKLQCAREGVGAQAGVLHEVFQTRNVHQDDLALVRLSGTNMHELPTPTRSALV
jgi:hypothetical protein